MSFRYDNEARWRASGEYEAWLEDELVRAHQEIQRLRERVSRGDIEWITDGEGVPSKPWRRPSVARTLGEVRKQYGWSMSLDTARKLISFEAAEIERDPQIRSDVTPAWVPVLSRWARDQ